MKHVIIIMLFLCGVTIASKACTACGCSANNSYLGLLPQTNNNFIGFQYTYRSFTTNIPDDGDGAPFGLSSDKYTTAQLWARYSISKRIQLFAFVPYISNMRTLNNETTINSGMGDITLMGNYRLLEKNQNAYKQVLFIGLGLKLPTGKYGRDAIKSEEGLPNMQPGTSSWDMTSSINYTVGYKKCGVNTDLSYTYTTPNPDSYKFGNRVGVGVLYFYKWNKRNVTLLPQLGARYDYTSMDYMNYATGEKDELSGGWQLHGVAGIQAYYGQVSFQFMYHQPIDQYYPSGMVTMKNKIEAGILLFF